MEPLNLSEIAAFTGSVFSGNNIEITSVSTDSRKLDRGSLFIPLKGEKADGHSFLAQAAKTCAAVLSEHEISLPVPVLHVEDSLKALGALAAGYKKKFTLSTVAITGSAGKTTTKEMLSAMLSEKFVTHSTQGNFNNNIGVPLTLLGIDRHTQAAVVEMGMNHFGEISLLSKMTAPDLGVIASAGTQHIEFLGSREGIVKAKLEILDGMAADAPLVLNGDDALLWQQKETLEQGRRLIVFGADNPNCDVTARNIMERDGGTAFTIVYSGGKIDAFLPVAGAHNVKNALGAAAAALYMGISPESVAHALAGFENTGMRQKTYLCSGFTIIEDCYNAGPESMAAALKVLGTHPGRRIAVLGDMLELGSYGPELHRQLGTQAAQAADEIFLFGEATTYARETAGAKARHFSSKDELVRALKDSCLGGETILFKGSRGMRMEDMLKKFVNKE